MALLAGATLGAYRIVEPLGRGGMGSVYKAYEASLERHVALKVLPGAFLHDEGFADRFRREARVIARLEHPNIVPIFSFGIERGVPWMAMRMISGGTLAGLLRRQRLDGARVAAILRGVAEALDYAHTKGVVHRDVKPQNVLLDEAQHVYLADFGIAHMLEGAGGLTQTGTISGTPQYMAPEQAVARAVDHRADIYALGIMAYEMLTGRVPFSADTPVAVLIKHVQEPLPLPAEGEFPAPLVQPLLKATAKDPADRWPSALAFVDALEAGLAERGLGTLRTPGEAAIPHRGAGPSTPMPVTDVRPAARATLAGARVPAATPDPQWFMPFAIAVGAITLLMFGGAAAYVVSWRDAPQIASATALARGSNRPAPAAPAARTAPSPDLPERAPAAPLPKPGRLALDFEHGLESGTLQVWLDEDLVLSESLDSRVTRKVLGIAKRKGRLDKDLEVRPGAHAVRVEVCWDDNRRTKVIAGNFNPGVTRRLEARVGGLRKSLSLDLK
jgi:hypothetical protein